MNELIIINRDGQLVVDSREVAEMTGKQHKDLLESIRGYIKHLESGNFRSQDFFIESTYINSQNKEQPCFLLTRKGCDMVANKMTGEKGVLFTAAYVTKFEEMEQILANPYKGLSKELQAIFILDKKQQELESRVLNLEENMTVDYGQQLTLQEIAKKRAIEVMGGTDSPTYRNSSIRGKVFSQIWKDYKDYFQINSYKNTARKDFERANEYLRNWQAQGKLLREIEDCNNQMQIDKEAM